MTSLETCKLFNVKGKIILITGGSRGIGKMAATAFVKNGAKVYISSRSANACSETAEELNRIGPGECIAIPADLQKISEVWKLGKELQTREKMLHVLVNSAGATWVADIDEYPDSAWEKLLTLNVQRVFNLVQCCLPLLRAAALAGGKDGEAWKDPARIINVGSVEGIYAPAHESFAYSASKAALHHLSKTLAGRLGDEGITSNIIACGPYRSKMTEQTLRKFGDMITSYVPLSRIGTPEDIGGVMLYLSSRAGAYVTGATIAVDGGLLVSRNGKL